MSEAVTKIPSPKSETVAQRIRRLQSEARALARAHVGALTQALGDVQRLAGEIADGGEAYPAGVRDVARRLIDECEARAQTLESISGRVG